MTKNAWFLTYTDVMGLCRLAYSDKSKGKDNTTFRIGLNQWKILRPYEKEGFHAILATGKGTNNNPVRVLAFAGSDLEANDWGTDGNAGTGLKGSENTMQYQHGYNLASSIKPDYLLGHSLGGGIANYCSLKLHIRAATINPAPVIAYYKLNEDISETYESAWSINYCVDYEGLAPIRNVYSGIPGERVTVLSTTGPLSPVAKHKLPYLYGFIDPIEKK